MVTCDQRPSAWMRFAWRSNTWRAAIRYLWPTKAAAKRAVGEWIERAYNRRTRHSALAMMSPVDFEGRLTQTAQAA